jgi:hypothetical protein
MEIADFLKNARCASKARKGAGRGSPELIPRPTERCSVRMDQPSVGGWYLKTIPLRGIGPLPGTSSL